MPTPTATRIDVTTSTGRRVLYDTWRPGHLAVLRSRRQLLYVLPALQLLLPPQFLDSDSGQNFLSGNWGWFGLILVWFVFNTVLGEELLFRGLLLPRMNRTFGRGDWAANGVFFAAYHIHVPWAMPATVLFDTFAMAYPTKRYRSAWIGIAVHSVQSVFLTAIILAVVL